MMKIGFRADGSEKIGLGHLMRCSALGHEFMRKGDQVIFYCMENTSGIAWLQANGFEVEVVRKRTLSAAAKEMIDKISIQRIDILFLDSYELSSDYIERVAATDTYVVCIDDGHRYRYHCDAVLNCNLTALQLDFSDCQVSDYFLGGEYNILREEFVRIPQITPSEKVKSILVTMGGSDPNNYTPTVLKGLQPIKDVTVHVVVGPLMKNIHYIENNAACCAGNVVIHNNPKSMAALMAKCELAISAGGGTVRELFTIGLLPLFILQADNQKPLERYLDEHNLPLCLGTFRDVGPARIQHAVEMLMDSYQTRKQLSNSITGLLNQNGTEYAVRSIRKKASNR